MSKEYQILHNAINELRNQTGKKIEFIQHKNKFDSIIDAAVLIDRTKFIVEVKSEFRASNKGIILSKLNELKNKTTLPVIVIANYIANEIQDDLKAKGINYIDINGNAFINEPGLFIYISGKKLKKSNQKNHSIAFQEAGIKLIFSLLTEPHLTAYSYRALAGISDISLGSISNIMNELEEQNFIIRTAKGRKLKNIKKLLNRWVIAYNEILKPRILLNRMRFAKTEDYYNWDKIPLQDTEDINLWGAEPAAALKTGYLQPEIFTIYTNSVWQSIASELRLIPDEEGKVEIRQIFWNEAYYIKREDKVAPPLLIYADLMGTGDDRNIETANIILENELLHIRE
jgi:hypothetical protein